MSKRRDLLLALGALAVVVTVLTFGFRLLGPPRDQRAISADARRLADLRTIAQQIQEPRISQLPATLDGLKQRLGANLNDPLTNIPYEYHPKSGTAYELCAVFATDSTEGENEYQQISPFWRHPKGRHCYQLDASKTL